MTPAALTPADETARRRSIGFLNCGHFLDHYVILIFPTVVLGLEAVYGRSYGDLESAVAEAIVETVNPIRERYQRLMADPAELDRTLALGAEQARAIAEPKIAQVKERVGFLMPVG